jgi:hypothetical protein
MDYVYSYGLLCQRGTFEINTEPWNATNKMLVNALNNCDMERV